MQVIDCRNLPENEFKSLRRQRLGSSDLGVLAGLYGSRLQLYLTKIGAIDGIEVTEEMRAGLGLEDHIANEYCRATGREIKTTQSMIVDDWRHATVDALCTDGRYCEWKAVGLRTASRLDPGGDPDSLPEGWLLQTHQAMDLLAALVCDVCVFVGPELKTRIYTVPFRPKLAAAAKQMGRQFWFEHVIPRVAPMEFQAGDLPAIKQAFREDTGEVLVWDHYALEDAKEIEEYRRERLDHENLAKWWGEREDAAKASLLFKLGNASGAELPDGWSISRTIREKRGYTVEASRYVDLRIKAPKTKGENE